MKIQWELSNRLPKKVFLTDSKSESPVSLVDDDEEEPMDFDTAMEPETMVSLDLAKREIKQHHLEWSDFLAETGPEKESYHSREILIWLGY